MIVRKQRIVAPNFNGRSVGQLGIGNTQSKSIPTRVVFFDSDYYVAQVAVGDYHTIALTGTCYFLSVDSNSRYSKRSSVYMGMRGQWCDRK